MLTALELLNSVEVPVDKSRTERAYLRLWVVKFQVVEVYNAKVPSALGRAEPRRGALSIASGVKVPAVALEAALTLRTLESKSATRESGDRIIATILTAVSLKGFEGRKQSRQLSKKEGRRSTCGVCTTWERAYLYSIFNGPEKAATLTCLLWELAPFAIHQDQDLEIWQPVLIWFRAKQNLYARLEGYLQIGVVSVGVGPLIGTTPASA